MGFEPMASCNAGAVLYQLQIGRVRVMLYQYCRGPIESHSGLNFFRRL